MLDTWYNFLVKKKDVASTKLSRSVSYETIKDRNMRQLILDSCPLYTQRFWAVHYSFQ